MAGRRRSPSCGCQRSQLASSAAVQLSQLGVAGSRLGRRRSSGTAAGHPLSIKVTPAIASQSARCFGQSKQPRQQATDRIRPGAAGRRANSAPHSAGRLISCTVHYANPGAAAASRPAPWLVGREMPPRAGSGVDKQRAPRRGRPGSAAAAAACPVTPAPDVCRRSSRPARTATCGDAIVAVRGRRRRQPWIPGPPSAGGLAAGRWRYRAAPRWPAECRGRGLARGDAHGPAYMGHRDLGGGWDRWEPPLPPGAEEPRGVLAAPGTV